MEIEFLKLILFGLEREASYIAQIELAILNCAE